MPIPKIIHYCWFGESEIPDEFKAYIETWKKLCPDYEIKLWNESNYDVTKNKYMREAYEHKKWGFVPDYARLDIIYNEGGIYLDTDIEIVKSFDELLENEGFCGIESGEEKVAFGLGFGAQKGNEVIKALRDYYDGLSFVKDNGELDMLPSPVINTEVLYKLGYSYSKEIQELSFNGSSLTVFPEEYFSPMNYSTGNIELGEKTYSIHHYAATWQSEEQKRRHAKHQKRYNKYIARYGEEKTEQIFARRNSMLRALYYLCHPVLAVRKIKEKLS